MQFIRNDKIKKGFTLVELLIIIAIITVIAAILVLILNPVEYIRRGRDAQRLRDYTLINQSVNLYAYGESIKSGDPDFDGPNYDQTCKGDSNQTIYVSVPSDNGEDTPSAPSGWTYNRVGATPLRFINGSGWLPIDFGSVDDTIRPLDILPVDPINTFGDGLYYTYTCGSYELNLRFETDKYNELASKDGGDDPNVYETGSNLATAPQQEVYEVKGTKNLSSDSSSGTLVLYPNATYNNGGWTITGAATAWEAVDDTKGSSDTSDYIRAGSANLPINFELTNSGSIPDNATITEIRMYLSQAQGATTESLLPRLRASSSASYVAGTNTIPPLGSWEVEALVSTWDNSTLGLTPSGVNDLQAGLLTVDDGAWSSASIDVGQMYIEIDYQ